MWIETPKGYATFCDETKSLLVVFWDVRKHGWKYVCESIFSDVYPTLSHALSAAEAQWLDGAQRDRSSVIDVPPEHRRAARDQQRQHQQGAQQTNYERTYGDPYQGRRGRQHHQEAPQPRRAPPQQPYRFQWAVILELPGNGPWTAADVKAQYRKLAMQYHPDRGGNAAKMAAINAAHEQAMAWL